MDDEEGGNGSSQDVQATENSLATPDNPEPQDSLATQDALSMNSMDPAFESFPDLHGALSVSPISNQVTISFVTADSGMSNEGSSGLSIGGTTSQQPEMNAEDGRHIEDGFISVNVTSTLPEGSTEATLASNCEELMSESNGFKMDAGSLGDVEDLSSGMSTVSTEGLGLAANQMGETPVMSGILTSQSLIPQSSGHMDQFPSISSSESGSSSLGLRVWYPGDGGMPELSGCRWLDCQAKFPSLNSLVNHVNEQHVRMERDVEYQCKWKDCPRKGKGFNARYKMLIHVRTHTNEKPHRCSLCSKSFSRLENLKIHNRSHTGEKPYTCPFEGCTKAYSNSSDRFKHVRTHQMDKPYTCKMPGCNKRYTDPSSLRKHVKTHGHHVHTSPRSLAGSSQPRDSQQVAQAQLISISGNLLQISNLTSNPLLSSTVVPTTQSTATQTEVTTSPVTGEGREQEAPLDLSTSPISQHTDDTKWELVSIE